MWTFRPRLLPTIASVFACSVFVGAGLWQLDRAEQRRERFHTVQEALDAPAMMLDLPVESPTQVAWRKVKVSGRFDHSATAYIDNRVLDGKPGYHIVTPLKSESGGARHVLVNRGWVGLGDDRSVLPAVPMPTGPMTIEGIVVELPARSFEVGSVEPKAAVWPNLSLDRFKAGRGLNVEPFVVLQTSSSDDQLIRRWSLPASGADKNTGYAFQWFSFAAVTLIFYAIFTIKRPSR